MKYMENLTKIPGAQPSAHPGLTQRELEHYLTDAFRRDPKASRKGGTTVATLASWHEILHARHPVAISLLTEIAERATTGNPCVCLRCSEEVGAGGAVPKLVLVRSTAKPKVGKKGHLRGWKPAVVRASLICDLCLRKYGEDGICAWIAEIVLPGVESRRALG